ncbi:hypothetical protein GBA52_007845 [Prunus armeniaca]|nr:hypothetical protein GBA52_007845 [Prunus armeniaca]
MTHSKYAFLPELNRSVLIKIRPSCCARRPFWPFVEHLVFIWGRRAARHGFVSDFHRLSTATFSAISWGHATPIIP